MVTKSECEHDIGFYRAISGDGGDIVESVQSVERE
jgi:hypothetical protein